MKTGDRIAITGNLVDVRNVNTHKCARMVVDVPAEQAAEIIRMFGWPTMVDPVTVIVARMETSTVVEFTKPDKPLAEPNSQPGYAQRIAILCQKKPFRAFLNEKFKGEAFPVDTPEEAAQLIRTVCQVASRREIKPGTEPGNTWHELQIEYENWERALV